MDWSDALKVGHPVIDEDHEHFVKGISAAVAASDAEFPTHFAGLVAHTHAHFAREEALMEATGFFAIGMHKAEHQRVLALVGQVAAQLDSGDLAAARRFVANDLPAWFLDHRNTMDLVTAMFARQRGHI